MFRFVAHSVDALILPLYVLLTESGRGRRAAPRHFSWDFVVQPPTVGSQTQVAVCKASKGLGVKNPINSLETKPTLLVFAAAHSGRIVERETVDRRRADGRHATASRSSMGHDEAAAQASATPSAAGNRRTRQHYFLYGRSKRRRVVASGHITGAAIRLFCAGRQATRATGVSSPLPLTFRSTA